MYTSVDTLVLSGIYCVPKTTTSNKRRERATREKDTMLDVTEDEYIDRERRPQATEQASYSS